MLKIKPACRTDRDQGLRIPAIGAHTSIAKGYLAAFQSTLEIGGDALQIFTKSPRGSALKQISETEGMAIQNWEGRSKIRYAVIHSSYLLNFAKSIPKDSFEKKSLIDDLVSADKIGADGVVLHIGKTLKRDPEEAENLFVQNTADILKQTKNLNAKIILENTAGQGTEMSYRFEELGHIFHAIKKDVGKATGKRLAICLDTAHTFASGYNLKTKSGVAETLTAFEEHIGLKELACVHFNDSKKLFGSRVDRHQDIGHGTIGESGLREFVRELNSRAKRPIPLILETPEEHANYAAQIKLTREWC